MRLSHNLISELLLFDFILKYTYFSISPIKQTHKVNILNSKHVKWFKDKQTFYVLIPYYARILLLFAFEMKT